MVERSRALTLAEDDPFNLYLSKMKWVEGCGGKTFTCMFNYIALVQLDPGFCPFLVRSAVTLGFSQTWWCSWWPENSILVSSDHSTFHHKFSLQDVFWLILNNLPSPLRNDFYCHMFKKAALCSSYWSFGKIILYLRDELLSSIMIMFGLFFSVNALFVWFVSFREQSVVYLVS